MEYINTVKTDAIFELIEDGNENLISDLLKAIKEFFAKLFKWIKDLLSKDNSYNNLSKDSSGRVHESIYLGNLKSLPKDKINLNSTIEIYEIQEFDKENNCGKKFVNKALTKKELMSINGFKSINDDFVKYYAKQKPCLGYNIITFGDNTLTYEEIVNEVYLFLNWLDKNINNEFKVGDIKEYSSNKFNKIIPVFTKTGNKALILEKASIEYNDSIKHRYHRLLHKDMKTTLDNIKKAKDTVAFLENELSNRLEDKVNKIIDKIENSEMNQLSTSYITKLLRNYITVTVTDGMKVINDMKEAIKKTESFLLTMKAKQIALWSNLPVLEVKNLINDIFDGRKDIDELQDKILEK